MDEPPRKSGGAEVRGEYVMKSTWSEETRMSVLDHYLVDPNVSMLAKRLTRNGKDCAFLFRALLVCGSSQPVREQLHRSEIEPDLTAGDGGLKVFGEAAVAVEPSEGSFDHPAARQDTRARKIGPFDDLDSPPAVSGQCRGQLIADIAAIGKDMAQPGNR